MALTLAIASIVIWFPGAVLLVLDALSSLGGSEGGPPYDPQYLLPGLVLTSLAPFLIGGVALILGLVARGRARRVAGPTGMATTAAVMGGIACGLGLLWTGFFLATGRFGFALSTL